MTTRSGAVLIGLCLPAFAVVLIPPLAQAKSATAKQSADLVLCDRLAAAPADPDRPSDIAGTAEIAPADVALAIKFCKIAAFTSRRALYELGRAYAANRQWAEAVNAYRKAADKGSTAAMVELGLLYEKGSGVPQDREQARILYARAAEGGDPRGATNLAALAVNGGTPADPVQARALLAKAVETNSAEAQFELGLMMANGIGGPQDDVGARALFEKAAAQGHGWALDWMGSFAENGRGGPKDANAAKAYYEKAAALGIEDAKAALKRLQCPLEIRDKRGNVVTNLCF